MPRVLVREPSPLLADGLLTHIDRRPIDFSLARAQWDAYVDAWLSSGWEVTAIEPAPGHPDSVFIEDTMVVRGTRALIARPGAPQRRGEVAGAQAAVSALGLAVGYVDSPQTLDGGDVPTIGDVTYVGVGGRSTPGGCARLGEFFDTEVVPVPVTRALHLKSAVTALPDGTVIGFSPVVDDPGQWDRFLSVPEEPGCHVVILDEETVLMATSAPVTAQLLAERGLRTVTVDISEFEKLEGCVTCLSVRLRDQ